MLRRDLSGNINASLSTNYDTHSTTLYHSTHTPTSRFPHIRHTDASSNGQTVERWLKICLSVRLLKASTFYGICSLLFFLACVLLLQISLWHPVNSLQAMLAVALSLATFGHGLLFATFQAICAFIIGRYAFSFDIQDRLLASSWRNWLLYFILLDLNILSSLCLFAASKIFISSWSRFSLYFALVAIAATTYTNVFNFNYRLVFPLVQVKVPSSLKMAWFAFSKGTIVERFMKTLKLTLICLIISDAPLFGWTILRNLFAISIYYYLFVTMVAQLVLHHFTASIVKSFFLQQRQFPMPHASQYQRTRQKFTLLDGLDSSDLETKAFAFWDLRNLCVTSFPRRSIILSLSQPGGHPRNWKRVKKACLVQINDVKDRIANENDRIRAEVLRTLNNCYTVSSRDEKGPTLLLVDHPGIRDCHSKLENWRSMNEEEKSIQSQFFYDLVQKYLQKLRTWTYGEPQIISACDAYLTILAAESLTAMISFSVEEDEFGVVYIDLGDIIKAMLDLCQNLQGYLRYLKTDKKLARVIYQPLLSTLTVSLVRIKSIFSEKMIVKRLSENDMTYFETLTRQD